jgi:putative ABC transport system permease protein
VNLSGIVRNKQISFSSIKFVVPLLEDIRSAFRILVRDPGYAGVAILALALGIGPNSAIFSMVSAVLLRPLPVTDADRIVTVWETWKAKGFDQIPASASNYLDWKEQNHVFEKMAAAFAIPEYGFNVTAGGVPERVSGAKASAEYLEVLGVEPSLGRGFLPEEDRPGGPPVVVVSHAFWQRRLSSGRDAIGRTIAVDGVQRTLVGVLPPGFSALGNIDIWVPLALNRSEDARANRTYGAVARLKEGVTVEQAQAEMNGIAQAIARQYPETNDGWGVVVIPIRELFSGRIAPALKILLGAVGLLLLLACANVANLMLAKSAARRKDVAVRTALGAGRWRIARQLLTESVVIALAGGACGLVLARWCVGLLRGVVPDMFPLMKQMTVDVRVIVFTIGVSVASGLIFGILPALHGSRTNLNEVLKAGSRSVTGTGVQRIRGFLLAGEVALAVVLSVAAALLAKSFMRLMAVDPGIRTSGVLTMQLTLPWVKYQTEAQRASFYRDALERISRIPGVDSAGAIHFLPFRGYLMNTRISVWPYAIEGEPPVRKGQEPTADYRVVTPGFFTAMGVPLRQGRYFSERDSSGAPGVVIVNEAMARHHFGGANPIGKRLRVPPSEPSREIVGVVPDFKLYALDWQPEPAIYVPHAQRPGDVMSLVVHSSRNPPDLASAIRREILALDPEQPISDVRMMQAVVSDSLMLRRVAMLLVMAFAGLALVLAIVGVYGLTAYSVSQRTQEVGIRLALGAQGVDVFRLMVGHGMALAAIGTALGMAGSFAASRVLSGVLFETTATDATILTGIPAALLLAAAVASYVPARRSMKIAPVVALHYE